MRLLLKIVAALSGLYLLLAAGLLALMHQPPERFAASISKAPPAAMMLLPFRPLWFVAREGRLKVGDAATDFDLPTLDRKSRVRLSEFRSRKPVVLVFGSYT